MTPTESLQEEIRFLLDQLRLKEIDSHQFMVFLDIIYKDFLEMNPEEHPYYDDRQRIKESVKEFYKRNRS